MRGLLNIRWLVAAFVLTGGVFAFAQPAAQLTELRVINIASPIGGSESIQPYQYATNNGHAGSTMLITTTEIGIGASSSSNGQIAKMNGTMIQWTARRSIISSGITIGFEYDWTYSGVYINGGTFTYENISVNFPYTKLQTQLTILPYYPPPVFSSTNQQYFSSNYGYLTPVSYVQPTPASYQFQATDPDGGPITFALEGINGKQITNNIQITSTGLFTWNGVESSTFVQSTSCPYPYYAQINVVATNSHSISSRLLITLQVQPLPIQYCTMPINPNNN